MPSSKCFTALGLGGGGGGDLCILGMRREPKHEAQPQAWLLVFSSGSPQRSSRTFKPGKELKDLINFEAEEAEAAAAVAPVVPPTAAAL